MMIPVMPVPAFRSVHLLLDRVAGKRSPLLASLLTLGLLASCSHGDRIEELEKKFNASEQRTEAMAEAINNNFKHLEAKQNDIIDHVSRVCFEQFDHYIKMFPCSDNQRRQLNAQWKSGV